MAGRCRLLFMGALFVVLWAGGVSVRRMFWFEAELSTTLPKESNHLGLLTERGRGSRSAQPRTLNPNRTEIFFNWH